MIQCLNFGEVHYAGNDYGEIVGGRDDGATEWRVASNHCYYDCNYNGDIHTNNESMYTDDSVYRWAKMQSGEAAYKSTIDEVEGAENWLYQDLDKGTFETSLPVPIPEAGKVYCNILCDGTVVYSNDGTFQSTTSHDTVLGDDGCCTICGARYIKDAEGLKSLASEVNSSQAGKRYNVILDNDIVFEESPESSNFTPIGTSTSPFRGTFNGQGHRVKNMTVIADQNYAGLLGCVSGVNTVVKNVTIDSSCNVSSSASAVAGVIGGVNSKSGAFFCNVTLEKCGNEAKINGAKNAAGILGGVYGNDNSTVTFTNCYNTGDIIGSSESATLCAYVRKNYTIKNCYNSGNLSGGTSDQTFYRYAYSGIRSVSDCYDVNGSQTGVSRISAIQVRNGELCKLLNKTAIVFTQDIQTDAYPTLGTAGLINASELHIANATEMATFAANVNGGNTYGTTIVYLDDDIDLSALSAISSGDAEGYLCTTFSGTLEGNGHTLKNCSHALFYGTSQATIENVILEGFAVTDQPSLIARTSQYTTFSNIMVKNSSIKHTSDNMNNFGMITGWSNYDNIRYCTVESDCAITTNRRQIGGIAGESFNGTISYCRNSATITGDADYIGGIVGLSGNSDTGAASTIEYCVNTGTINGDDECGGIAGQYYKGTITNCVNIGTISSKDGDNHENTGGIVGKLCSATCDNSINFGSVAKAKSSNSQFAIYGGSDGTITATGNEYYCDVKGSHLDSGILLDDITSGKYAYTKDWLYQDIDNGTYTVTTYPVPFAEAGKVYSNILCDGTQSYSNKYQSTEAHASVTDLKGYCTVCGTSVGAIHINTADNLCEFANAVNSGQNFSTLPVYLDNDIDMSGVTSYTPIGTKDYKYSGTFDGQGYRIKNLVISQEGQNKGLFGCVNGTNTVIKNTIIDASCSIASTGTTSDDGAAVAGLVGGVWSASGDECNVTIENCGNEANVTGINNVAGILGGSYANDNNVITITNCYNTGAITGTTESAAICGYARKNYTITNCYNSGSLTGVSGTNCLYFTNKTGGTTSVSNCFDVNGTQDGVTKITADQVASGELCFLLNGNNAAGTWGHTCDDAHPVLSGAGMQHYSRTMANQWGTICLPFDSEIGDNYDFYTLTAVSNDALMLTKVEGTLAAGTPAIVRRNSGATGIDISALNTTFADAPVTGSSANGLTLTGAFSQKEITSETGYIISNNAFWNIADIKDDKKVYCSPFRAYLAGSISSGAKQLTIGGIDDAPTAIETIDSPLGNLDDAAIYDLNGRRIDNLQKGINIVKYNNGVTKKIIIK